MKGEVVVGTLYQQQLLLSYTNNNFSFHICPVDGVAHRNIGFRLFVHRFRLAFWSIKSFETSECESRIAGRSPCTSQSHLTNFSFEFFHAVFKEEASLLEARSKDHA